MITADIITNMTIMIQDVSLLEIITLFYTKLKGKKTRMCSSVECKFDSAESCIA